MIGTDVIAVTRFAPSAAPRTRVADAARASAEIATPIAFLDGFAYLHPAPGDIGIVFCGSWGYEALCAHRSCVEFAGMLASSGYPTLRFDYPGAGNSASDLDARSVDDWVDAVAAAADLLRRSTGVTQVVLAGFGFGCLIAAEAVARGLSVRGAVLLAPPQTGRRFIRETQALAAIIATEDDGSDEIPQGAVAIAGFAMPGAFAADARKLDLARLNLSEEAFCILAPKPEMDASDMIAALGAGGAEIRESKLRGYADIMAGPTMAVTPTACFEDVLGELRAIAPASLAEVPVALDIGAAPSVEGPGFIETAARFGDGERLFGVLCRPMEALAGEPLVIMISVGRNSHIGWRRMSVENARTLARMGIASLRFDLSGVGESAVRPGQPEQTLYSDWPALDVRESIDFAMKMDFGPVVLLGVCSGAFVGLQTAVSDGRVAGLIAANVYRLVWDPSEPVEQALRYGNRRIAPAVGRLLTRERMAKVLAGEGNLWPAVVHAGRRVYRRLGVLAMRWFGAAGPRGALYAECMRRFGVLRARNVETALLYSEGDDGLGEIEDYFGKNRKGLTAYPNVRVVDMERCDHNLTPRRASETMVAEVIRVVEAAQSRR